MKRRSVIALSIFLAFYILFGIFLAVNQEAVIYRPAPQDFATCPHFAGAQKVTHEGTRMYVHATSGPVAVLYHGNAGSACDRWLYADLFSRAGWGYIVVEYAGYSNDERDPAHARIMQDAKNVVSYLEEYDISEVVVVGESIGAGVAAYHASHAPPEKLLLLAPFTDLASVASRHYWFYPTSLLVHSAFDVPELLKEYTGAVTIIHGTDDRIIPYDLGVSLYEELSAEAILVPVEGAGHNDLFRFEGTYDALSTFLRREK